MWDWIKRHKGNLVAFAGVVGVFIPLFSIAFSAFEYVRIEREKLRQQSFNNYHAVVSKIGDGDASKAAVSAAFYELKNYPEYCALSLIITSHYQEKWKDLPLEMEAVTLVIPLMEKSCNVAQ